MAARIRSFLLAIALAVCVSDQPVFAQAGGLDATVLGGYALGIDDTPPHATLCRGGTASFWVSDRWRIGVEYLDADLFGRYENYEHRARLVTPVLEYQFRSVGGLRPYAVFGVGYTRWRTLEPNVHHHYDPTLEEFAWREQSGFNLAGGLGVRFHLTKRLFVAPEVRIGLLPVLRTSVAVGYTFF